ncbi:MAG: putative subtilase-family protease [Frankiales bacterium]|nr:putative subtilase-family protease [Frankiales bacterium]
MSARTAITAGALLTAAITSGSIGALSSAAALPTPEPASASTAADWVPSTVLVQWRPDAPSAVRASLLRTAEARVTRHLSTLGVDVLQVPAGAEQHVVEALHRSGRALVAERDGVVHATDVTPDDPYWPKEWGPSRVHAPTAWSTTTGSSAVTVAVLDTGLNVSLPEFSGRVLPGYNAFTGTADVTDDNSHGTAAAGVALAQGNNAQGVAGLCWQCSVLPVKVMDANGSGSDSTVAAGVTWAVDHGARVLSLSLGGSSTSSVLSSAITYAQNHGALVVAAAGNYSSSAPFYPAAYNGVLSVAATDQYDALYSYSDYGSWVDVAAPGSNYSVWPSGNVFLFGGTSSATPVVAGLAGLLVSVSPAATADQVQAAIAGTTTPVTGNPLAHGRVDAAAALTALTGTATPAVSPSSSPTVSPSPTVSASATPSPSAGATTTTSTASGSIPKPGTVTLGYTTSGGPVSLTLTSASATLTVSVLDSSGSTVVTGSGASGLTLSGTVPSGGFTVVLRGAARTKYAVSVSRPS